MIYSQNHSQSSVSSSYRGYRYNNISRSNIEAHSLNLILRLLRTKLKGTDCQRNRRNADGCLETRALCDSEQRKIPSAILSKVTLYNELLGFKTYSCTCMLPVLSISAANIKVNLEKDKAWETRLFLMHKLSLIPIIISVNSWSGGITTYSYSSECSCLLFGTIWSVLNPTL